MASTQTRAGEGGDAPRPRRTANAWFPEIGRREVPVYDREVLRVADQIEGPAIVLEATGTVVLDPGFRARVDRRGVLVLEDGGAPRRRREVDLSTADPVRLEVFGNRFMSIAEQMGAVLRNTALSTNIKERLDYSCAVFDREGGLVANAPHIPVHLGAMGETVRAVLEAIPDLAQGDAIITNDPSQGGSHLPDVTVVTPVFLEGALSLLRGEPRPPRRSRRDDPRLDARRLPQPRRGGRAARAFPLVRAGRFDEARVRRAAHRGAPSGPQPGRQRGRPRGHGRGQPQRRAPAPRDGRRAGPGGGGDHHGPAAAGGGRQGGARRSPGSATATTSSKTASTTGHRSASISQVEGGRMRIDFAGTGPRSPGNLNAPRAVVEAAVIYVLRCLVAERIPLNGGCLAPVEIVIPEGCLLDPPPGAAVVGGNVETSQRIVDVLLGAIGRVAASQGTMNNVTFGDESFGYYETIGGGAGAGDGFDGASGVHTHMTNTRITDPEVLEARYPVRLERFALAPGLGRCRALAGRRRPGALLPVPGAPHRLAPDAAPGHPALRSSRGGAGKRRAKPPAPRARGRGRPAGSGRRCAWMPATC